MRATGHFTIGIPYPPDIQTSWSLRANPNYPYVGPCTILLLQIQNVSALVLRRALLRLLSISVSIPVSPCALELHGGFGLQTLVFLHQALMLEGRMCERGRAHTDTRSPGSPVSSFVSSLSPDATTPPSDLGWMVILLLLPIAASSSRQDLMWTVWTVSPSG